MDNRIENLRLVSHSENLRNRKSWKKEVPKKTPEEIEEIRKSNAAKRRKKVIVLYNDGEETRYESAKEAAKGLGVSVSLVSSIARGHCQKPRDYRIFYI